MAKRVPVKRRPGLVDTVQEMLFGREEPEAKLLRKRDHKRRGFKGHLNAWLAVNGGLALLNLLTALTVDGASVIWFPYVAISWGIGLTIHGLGYRGWLKDNEDAILDAEIALGILPEGAGVRSLPSGEARAQRGAQAVDGVAIADPQWLSLLSRARRAREEIAASLETAGSGMGAGEARAHLKQGMEDLERLAAGAERMRLAVEDIQPPGDDSLADQIAHIDARIQRSQDARLKEVLLANRAHLLSLRAKVDALTAERERMLASAEGFLLAADNLRLDAARLGAGQTPDLRQTLAGPTSRLGEEVAILRQVEAELKQL